jgi:hypothetical protein
MLVDSPAVEVVSAALNGASQAWWEQIVVVCSNFAIGNRTKADQQ